MARLLALGERDIPLDSMPQDSRGLIREEIFEDAVCLSLCCMCEDHLNIQATWSAPCQVKTLNVIRGCKRKAVQKMYQTRDRT